MFALELSGELQTALASLIGVLVTYLSVQARRQSKATREVDGRIGDPNGHGTVVAMLEEVLQGNRARDMTTREILTRVKGLEGRVIGLEAITRMYDETPSRRAEGSGEPGGFDEGGADGPG